MRGTVAKRLRRKAETFSVGLPRVNYNRFRKGTVFLEDCLRCHYQLLKRVRLIEQDQGSNSPAIMKAVFACTGRARRASR